MGCCRQLWCDLSGQWVNSKELICLDTEDCIVLYELSFLPTFSCKMFSPPTLCILLHHFYTESLTVALYRQPSPLCIQYSALWLLFFVTTNPLLVSPEQSGTSHILALHAGTTVSHCFIYVYSSLCHFTCKAMKLMNSRVYLSSNMSEPPCYWSEYLTFFDTDIFLSWHWFASHSYI